MAQYDINLREYSRILKKRKFTVILTAIILGTFSTVFAILKAPTPLYTSECRIKFERETTVEGLYAKTMSWSGADDLETQISVIKSYSIMEKVAEKLGLIPKKAPGEESPSESQTANIVGGLQARVGVERESFTNIINIGVTGTDPAFAQKLANTVATVYKDSHRNEQNTRTREAVKYIADQLEKVRGNLKRAENEFNTFTQKNQLVSIDLQSEGLLSEVKQLNDYLRKMNETQSELDELLVKLDRFIKNPTGSDHNFFSAYANQQYQDDNERLIEILLKRDSSLQDYTGQHPEVVKLRREIVEKTRKMRILTKLQIDKIAKKRTDVKKALAKVAQKTNKLMRTKLEYGRLKRKVDSYNSMTVLLEEKNQEALIRQAEKPDEITIVRPALLSTFPINPPKTTSKAALGVIVGLVLGLVIAFVVETFDTSLGAIQDVEEELGTQVLGIIPETDMGMLQQSTEEKSSTEAPPSPFRGKLELASHFSPQSVFAEGFRGLRTNIHFRDLEKNVQTMVVTSASRGEGKSTCSTNLAITMAQAGTKTLLVEADLRKPKISQAFGLDWSPGMTDVLLGNYSLQEVVRSITDLMMGKMGMEDAMATPGLDNLHILTVGDIPPNPAELIASKRLVEAIEEMKREFEFVIFDAPPILSTTDPVILGKNLDVVLLVYRVGSIAKTLLKRAANQLLQVDCNILGVVLNGMKADTSPDFQGYKYYKSYYYYGQEEEKGTLLERVTSFARSIPQKAMEKLGKAAPGDSEKEAPYENKVQERVIAKKSGKLKLFILIGALTALLWGIFWQATSWTHSRESSKPKITNKVKKKITRAITQDDRS